MSAAAGAAGYLYASGKLTRTHEHSRDQGEEGRVCPFCSERLAADVFEFHLFIAHKRTERKR